ncbi:hypothetical protein QTP88_012412 [Uroleucon formosanum]
MSNHQKPTFETCRKNSIVGAINNQDLSQNNQNLFPGPSSENDTNLDQMINGINIRFSQETLDMIKSVASILELNVGDNDITILTKTFNLKAEILKSELLGVLKISITDALLLLLEIFGNYLKNKKKP